MLCRRVGTRHGRVLSVPRAPRRPRNGLFTPRRLRTSQRARPQFGASEGRRQRRLLLRMHSSPDQTGRQRPWRQGFTGSFARHQRCRSRGAQRMTERRGHCRFSSKAVVGSRRRARCCSHAEESARRRSLTTLAFRPRVTSPERGFTHATPSVSAAAEIRCTRFGVGRHGTLVCRVDHPWCRRAERSRHAPRPPARRRERSSRIRFRVVPCTRWRAPPTW
jgi:hypothetical protein